MRTPSANTGVMRLTRGLVAAVMLATGVAVVGAAQGAPPPGPPPGGGGGGGRGGAPAQLDFASAKLGVDAAEAAAKGMSATVAIAVVDANGDLVYFRRMDGASSIAVTSAQGKARASILFGVPSKALQDAVAAGTTVSATLRPAAANAPITAVQGAIPIVKNGKVVGAIGVGGSTSQNDEVFAQAGVNAIK